MSDPANLLPFWFLAEGWSALIEGREGYEGRPAAQKGVLKYRIGALARQT